MNSGYTLLAIGALVLMMIAVINANRLIVSADAQSVDSEQYSQAVALAEALFGEIRAKKFDHAARDTVLTPPSFTLPLGPEVGTERDSCTVPDTTDYRSAQWYNDIDDYNGYSRIVRIPGIADYRLDVQVFYVSESNFATQSLTQTYLKKVVVTAENQSNLSRMTFSSIQAY